MNAGGGEAAGVCAYHRDFGLPFPALLDPSANPGSFHAPGSPGPVSTAYRVSSYPTFYVIDPTGLIAWRADNEQPDALILEKLKDAGL